MSQAPRVHRDVVSYVRRSGRMNQAQQRAWDAHHADWVIEVPAGERQTSIAPEARVDWDQVFGRSAPLRVEIGSGAGHALTALAEAMPEANLVAFEVFAPAVAATLGRLARHRVSNVRIVIADGAQALASLFEPASVDELWTFFPDPWHKARHNKRRLVNPDFAELVATRLRPGGCWRLATDWEDYAEVMLEVLSNEPTLRNSSPDWAPRFDLRPVTKYERRGLEAGRTIRDLCFTRP